MKKIASVIISVLILVLLVLLLSSCSTRNGVDIVFLNDSGESKEESPGITVQSPMTLSNNDLSSINGEHQYLRLKMVKGKYYEDWTPGAYIDFPFGDIPICIKVNKEIFAQLYPNKNDYKITLNCDRITAEFYRSQYPNIVVRGYYCPPRTTAIFQYNFS